MECRSPRWFAGRLPASGPSSARAFDDLTEPPVENTLDISARSASATRSDLCGGSGFAGNGTLEEMAAIVNVNGRIADEEHASVSVFDHGFLYGEGVYETLRTYSGQPFLFDRHMRRLRRSAEMLALNIPPANEELDRRFRDTMEAAGLG